ncbi:hypothetical protein WLF18_01020 [Pseudomonas shirazensis]|uniref:Lysozyme inhibitor LprI N-terminal domain-containing protein n=1 Tax=Pseudomonas shirazensis TaxID=2745494 RepID=A0ABU8ZUE3_9PSED
MLRLMTCIGVLLLSGSALAAPPEIKGEQALTKDSQEVCRYDSTSRGVLDEKAFALCLVNQRRWIDQVIRMGRENQQDYYTKASYPFCYGRSTRRGTTNPGLMYMCLRSEIESYKDVMYYLDKLGQERVIPIIRAELAEYGSWLMVKTRIKNELDPPP